MPHDDAQQVVQTSKDSVNTNWLDEVLNLEEPLLNDDGTAPKSAVASQLPQKLKLRPDGSLIPE